MAVAPRIGIWHLAAREAVVPRAGRCQVDSRRQDERHAARTARWMSVRWTFGTIELWPGRGGLVMLCAYSRS